MFCRSHKTKEIVDDRRYNLGDIVITENGSKGIIENFFVRNNRYEYRVAFTYTLYPGEKELYFNYLSDGSDYNFYPHNSSMLYYEEEIELVIRFRDILEHGKYLEEENDVEFELFNLSKGKVKYKEYLKSLFDYKEKVSKLTYEKLENELKTELSLKEKKEKIERLEERIKELEGIILNLKKKT